MSPTTPLGWFLRLAGVLFVVVIVVWILTA